MEDRNHRPQLNKKYTPDEIMFDLRRLFTAKSAIIESIGLMFPSTCRTHADQLPHTPPIHQLPNVPQPVFLLPEGKLL